MALHVIMLNSQNKPEYFWLADKLHQTANLEYEPQCCRAGPTSSNSRREEAGPPAISDTPETASTNNRKNSFPFR
ncbi:hypothetical protein RRG08_017552 [Elysia crispata]|uniref:Uncharacterized protein n=1 Tax=Elysia crispata TaxID=231223 RepID=A0AAE1B889_9GAST|nr:hypothetical protein RRG08_017552 [Elysia crispata]